MSYGDISIFTRSPTVSRTQRLRILPEMVARTRCLLSSSTRNMVPGRTVRMTPSISTGVSFIRRFEQWPVRAVGDSPADQPEIEASEEGRAARAAARTGNKQESGDNGSRFLSLSCLTPGLIGRLVTVAPIAAVSATAAAATGTTAATGTLLARAGDIDVESAPAQFFTVQ